MRCDKPSTKKMDCWQPAHPATLSNSVSRLRGYSFCTKAAAKAKVFRAVPQCTLLPFNCMYVLWCLDRTQVDSRPGGSQRDVVYLGWPIAPSYMSPNSRGCGISANEYSCAHGAQVNFGDQTPYFNRLNSIDSLTVKQSPCPKSLGGIYCEFLWFLAPMNITCENTWICSPHLVPVRTEC
jgi:hypothetical protein